jgi:predicted phage tail protein
MNENGLVTVRLHGPLADTYGGEHRFAINSPREAIAALDANYPGFRRDFLKTQYYGLLVDGDWREECPDFDVATAPVARQVDFCPMVEGRITGAIVAGLGLIGVTGVTATILAGVITVGLLVGVSLLLAPKPKKKTAEDSPKDESYIFAGPENVTEQGVAVPLVYGRCFVGSVVVSAGLEVADQFIPGASTLLTRGPADRGFTWSP